MPSRVVLQCEDLGHDLGVYLLLDISVLRSRPEKYFVAITHRGRIKAWMGPVTWEGGLELFDSYRVYDRHGWKEVLDRLMGKPEQPPARWAGSVAQYASNFYDLGTWEWLQVLIASRNLKGTGAASTHQ